LSAGKYLVSTLTDTPLTTSRIVKVGKSLGLYAELVVVVVVVVEELVLVDAPVVL
jgi:hypothetical protein